MVKKWKDKWVKALRSGKYKQGYAKLKDRADRYCCLGVLLRVLHPKIKWFDILHKFNGKDDILLCNSVQDKVKLRNGVQDYLVSQNDSGSTFADIADYIEATL